MMSRNQPRSRPIVPTAKTVAYAQRVIHQLPDEPNRFALLDRQNGIEIEIDETVFELVRILLIDLSHSRAVSIIPTAHELTTHQAAEILNVSRPYLVKLLERNEIPHRMIGTHRRIRLEDLLAYQERSRAEGDAAMDELARIAQEESLY